jgi:integrase
MPRKSDDGLWKRPDSRAWWFTYRGEKVSTRTDDREAARLIRAREIRRREDPTYRAENETTVERAAERALEHLEHERKVAAGTLGMYRCKLGHVVRVLGTLTLERLTAATIDAYIATRREEGAHSNTIAKDLVAISQMLKIARRDGSFTRDPAAIMPLRFKTEYEPRERFVSEDEWPLLRDALPPHRAAWVAWCIAIGGRHSDVGRSKKGDADLAKGAILVDRRKRKGSQKVIPIVAPELVEFALEHADGEGDALFSPWPRWNLRRDLSAAVRRVNKRLAEAHKAGGFEGEPPAFAPLSANDLRRTMGSWLVQRGADPSVVAKFLGHTGGAKMVEKVYGRHTAESLRRLLPLIQGRDVAGNVDQPQPQTTDRAHVEKLGQLAVTAVRRRCVTGLWLRLSGVQASSVTPQNTRLGKGERVISRLTGTSPGRATSAAVGLALYRAWAGAPALADHDPLAETCARLAVEAFERGAAMHAGVA